MSVAEDIVSLQKKVWRQSTAAICDSDRTCQHLDRRKLETLRRPANLMQSYVSMF